MKPSSGVTHERKDIQERMQRAHFRVGRMQKTDKVF